MLTVFTYGVFGFVLALLIARKREARKTHSHVLGSLIRAMFVVFLLARSAAVFAGRFDVVLLAAGSLALLVSFVALIIGRRAGANGGTRLGERDKSAMTEP